MSSFCRRSKSAEINQNGLENVKKTAKKDRKKQKGRELTPKRLRFCEEYIIDLNGTKAAQRAGYSARSAKEQAARLLTNVNIQAKISELKEERSKRTQITADMVVQQLAVIGFSNMTDFAYWNGDGVVLTDIKDIPEEKRACVAQINETVTKNGGTVKIKLHDKVKALDLLAKHLDVYASNKQEHSGKNSQPTEVQSTYFPPEPTTMEEWIEMVAAMNKAKEKSGKASES